MPSPTGRGRGVADVADMSPLQQRLLNTYMDALAEQEAREETQEEEDSRQSRQETEERAAAARAAASRAEYSMAPAKGAREEDAAVDVSDSGASGARQRSDLYAKKMSELLLKGWKMLGENCPETGSVPLMQHPTNGRKFSIATGRYTDEPEVSASAVKEAAPSPGRPAPAPSPAVAQHSSPAPSPAKQPARLDRRSDDEWAETMGQLMLKGWKMLNEQCPLTGAVPLMEHPTNGRKFSVAAKKFMDEVDEAAAAPPAVPSAPSGTAASGVAIATLPAAPSPAARAARGRNDEDSEEEDDDDEAAAAIQARLLSAPRAKAATAGKAMAAAKPMALYMEPSPQPPPPTRVASSAAPTTHASAAAATSRGAGAYTPNAQALAALEDAAAAIAAQLAWSTSQLTATPPPAPKALLDGIGQLAESLQSVESARRALLLA